MRRRINYLALVPLCGQLALSPQARAALTHDNPAHEQLENQAMRWLAESRSRAEVIAPFTSDGCSGGLSAAWHELAEISGTFRQRYGETPPWEACCVDHDLEYWQGETEGGYQKRMAADERLRQCVIESGEQQSGELAEARRLSPEQVETLFRAAAETMYIAVRLGGGPCSGLPWRWGYGWPQCHADETPNSSPERPTPDE